MNVYLIIQASEQGDDVFKNRRSSMTDLITSSPRTGSRSESRGSVSDIIDELRPSNILNTNDSLRRKKRLSVINGHTYHTDVSIICMHAIWLLLG